MYWSVLSCVVLFESWTEFILAWVPFYAYIRLFFLLYLVLPQTQGARQIYETYLHPYLEENESAIEEFIANAHDRLKEAGLAYLKQAIELFRTRVLGLAPSEVAQEDQRRASEAPQGYTQALLARFSVPAARWAANNAGSAGHDFYNLLAGAVSAAAGSATGGSSSSTSAAARGAGGQSSTLIPQNIRDAQEKITFIAAQRERLNFVLGALDKEAAEIEKSRGGYARGGDLRPSSISLDGTTPDNEASRPPSGGSVWSGLSKSRSEVDFEKIDAESGAEDENGMRRRAAQLADGDETPGVTSKAWSFLGFGTTTTGPATPKADDDGAGRSSGFQK
ncbi:TB2/DP1, HVA22 family-domain-containing protein [Microdochium trichocladiopsis]|uniref:Protein YOP1 n=1 Tax=Microdochium trichocladiopsis TaxID=1682393 RepID=A0A9P8YI36_9PEZI|nr:TB2/DP1, HVA22 family-domain-containing protein [Microdochium trichocladiopsis]KAH7040911.1 TB2/DP1, HVA22 family-domain-containing protein [Microdochium trichocladiopsis]